MDRAGGFIALHRQLLDWPVLQGMSPAHGWTWVVMLLEANWKPSEVMVKEGRVLVHRGEFITGQEQLAAKAGVSRKVVRTLYAHLERDGAISHRQIGTGLGSKRGRRVVATTITNYARFQDAATKEGRRGAAEGPHQKKGKKGKNLLSPPDPLPPVPLPPSVDRVEEPIFNMDEWRRRRDERLSATHGHHGG